MSEKISDILNKNKKEEITPVNLECKKKLYTKLKSKLKKNNVTVRTFFESMAEKYVSED